MVDIKSLIDAASTLSSLRDFILSGEMTGLLGDVELEAAKEALVKSKLAKNPEGQIWSAINHLETARLSYQKAYKGRTRPWDSFYTMGSYGDMKDKEIYCLLIMAVCYIFLNEKILCKQAVNQAIELRNYKLYPNEPKLHSLIGFVRVGIEFWDPRIWYSVFIDSDTKSYKLWEYDFQKLTAKLSSLYSV